MEKEKKSGVENPKKLEKGDKVVFNDSVKKYTKVIGIILSFFAAAATIFMFVFGIIVSLKIVNLSKLELLTDNFSIVYLSNLHGTTSSEMQTIIQNYGNSSQFIVFKIIMPLIAFVVVMILLLILIKEVLDFVDSVTTEKELFNKNSILEVEKIACYLITLITITLLIFESPSLLIYSLICLLTFITLSLFRKVVYLKK